MMIVKYLCSSEIFNSNLYLAPDTNSGTFRNTKWSFASDILFRFVSSVGMLCATLCDVKGTWTIDNMGLAPSLIFRLFDVASGKRTYTVRMKQTAFTFEIEITWFSLFLHWWLLQSTT